MTVTCVDSDCARAFDFDPSTAEPERAIAQYDGTGTVYYFFTACCPKCGKPFQITVTTGGKS